MTVPAAICARSDPDRRSRADPMNSRRRVNRQTLFAVLGVALLASQCAPGGPLHPLGALAQPASLPEASPAPRKKAGSLQSRPPQAARNELGRP